MDQQHFYREQLAKQEQEMESFFQDYNLEECKAMLCAWMQTAFLGDFHSLPAQRRSNLFSFYTGLEQLILAAHQFKTIKELAEDSEEKGNDEVKKKKKKPDAKEKNIKGEDTKGDDEDEGEVGLKAV